MIWQDIVMSVVGWSFSIALIKSVRTDAKPARLTCGWTGAGLLVLAVCTGTLGLWLAAASNVLCGSMWFVLLFQKRRK